MTQEARQYAKRKRQLWLADLGVTFALLVGLLVSGWAQAFGQWVSIRVQGWPLQTAVYVGVLWGGLTLIGFPLDWIRGFWLEHRFGLSNQRGRQWAIEYGKTLAVGAILGLILVEGLAGLLQFSPERWWLWAAFAWLGWSVVLARVAPTLLIPIFYRQRPLSNEALRARLEQFLERCSMPVKGIFELNLSRTTKKANACLTGMGKTRRVLVSDTLASKYPAEEVEVVLAHEVGHHRLHHTGILIGVSTIATAVSCFAVHHLLQVTLARLGLLSLADLAVLPLVGLYLLVANLILMPITNGLSRRLEARADRFALEQTGNPNAFIATMQRLGEQNLAETTPPRWVEWLLYDHPAISRRINMAEHFERAA